jgi:hypothetical protein
MGDLFSHFAMGFGIGKLFSQRKVRIIFYMGCFLPDIVFKIFLYLTYSPSWYCEPSHSPLMILILCLFFAHLFEEDFRKKAFFGLLGGSYLHLILDLGKSYMGSGVILWAFPFSMDRIELGLYHQDDALYLVGAGVILILLIELTQLFLRKARLHRL